MKYVLAFLAIWYLASWLSVYCITISTPSLRAGKDFAYFVPIVTFALFFSFLTEKNVPLKARLKKALFYLRTGGKLIINTSCMVYSYQEYLKKRPQQTAKIKRAAKKEAYVKLRYIPAECFAMAH